MNLFIWMNSAMPPSTMSKQHPVICTSWMSASPHGVPIMTGRSVPIRMNRSSAPMVSSMVLNGFICVGVFFTCCPYGKVQCVLYLHTTLAVIASHRRNDHSILIDDGRKFSGRRGVPSVDDVRNALLSINGSYEISWDTKGGEGGRGDVLVASL